MDLFGLTIAPQQADGTDIKMTFKNYKKYQYQRSYLYTPTSGEKNICSCDLMGTLDSKFFDFHMTRSLESVSSFVPRLRDYGGQRQTKIVFA